MKNNAYTKDLPTKKVTPDIKVKNAPKTKPLTKAELIKEVESLKEHNAKQLVANRNETYKGKLYKDDNEILTKDLAGANFALETAKRMIVERDEEITAHETKYDDVIETNHDIAKQFLRARNLFLISSIALIGSWAWWLLAN